ncbi:MAG: EAL domain-containing protein [Actinomycetota bacterium]
MCGSRRVWILNVLLACLAAAGYVWVTRGLAPVGAPVRIHWTLLAAMFCLAEIFAVHVHVRRDTHSFSISELPIVLGLLFAPPSELILALVTGSAVALAIHRRQPLVKFVFNLSQYAIGTTLAVVVFQCFASASEPLGPRWWAAALGATLTIDLASALMITLAVSLLEGRLVWHALRGLPGLGLVATATNTGLALLAATVIWHDSRAAWLLTIAAAVMIVTYRAYVTTRQRYGSLELLYDSTRIVEKPLEEGSIIPEILRQLCAMFNAESAEVVAFANEEHEATSTYVRADGGDVVTEPARPDPGEGVWARVASEAQAVLIPRPIKNERLREHFESQGIRDAMVAPLYVANKVAGTIMVRNRLGDVGTFDHEDLKLFETFANHASAMVHNGELVDRLKIQAEQNQHQALHDALTGLPNRTLLRDRTRQAVLAAARAGDQVAIMMIDLDRFKEVNDTLGHHNGDLLLQEMARRLRGSLREGDTVARLGGDEFAVVLPRLSDTVDALRVAEAVRATLEQPIVLQEVTITVGASIGIALYPEHGEDSDTLMQRADVAMYFAKGEQAGAQIYAPERDPYSPARLALVGELRHAIESDELMLFFQPKADIDSGVVTGVEALVRWNHPRRGLVSPDDFIPLAEQTGLIGPLTYWVLDAALRQSAKWSAAGRHLSVAVNLSARTLLDQGLPDQIARRLRDAGVHPSSLTLEVTETNIMTDPARSIGTLSRLSSMGIAISIDDFGTGYSSLSYLQRLPVDEIKIDRSFVMGMTADEDDAVIVRSIIDLGRTLGLRVVAEGVETELAWNRLSALGCDVAQGYLLSKPLAAEHIAAVLDQTWPARVHSDARLDRTYAPHLALAGPAAR